MTDHEKMQELSRIEEGDLIFSKTAPNSGIDRSARSEFLMVLPVWVAPPVISTISWL